VQIAFAQKNGSTQTGKHLKGICEQQVQGNICVFLDSIKMNRIATGFAPARHFNNSITKSARRKAPKITHKTPRVQTKQQENALSSHQKNSGTLAHDVNQPALNQTK
jgi:hypothetical protein